MYLHCDKLANRPYSHNSSFYTPFHVGIGGVHVIGCEGSHVTVHASCKWLRASACDCERKRLQGFCTGVHVSM